jgi:selenocysteine lyase/cysteine desulfurase
MYERELVGRLLRGLARLPHIKICGITDPTRLSERVPTISLTHSRQSAKAVAEYLDRHGIFVWHGNFYAQSLTETLGLEPDGMVRIGLLHYNTEDEVDRVVSALAELR